MSYIINQNVEKVTIFMNIFAYCFLRDIHEGHLSLKYSDDEQSNFAPKLKNLDKSKETIEREFFKNNLGLLFSAKEKVLNKFKSRLFPIKNFDKIPICESTPEVATEPATEPINYKKSKLKLQQEFMNEVIANEKDINYEIFWNYFKYQNPSFLEKDLIKATQAKNEQLVNNVNNGLIALRKAIIKKQIPENENPKKILDIVEKILDFNKQQKGKGIKILTPKQIL